ncbi:DUF1501 domain-containing protein [Zavarzinella formosa]|uniref:DUF1501 domain-containing protein n=1 Tax=Zavarzinella formosa TaxID=360055 RepID=UPI00031B7C9E|nr:DUF1501 domain-containing protein [Zavarzinella formosa]
MLNLENGAVSRSQFHSRRELLRIGFLGLGGLTLADLCRLQARESVKDTAVILLFVHGGPSHLETYDMKPEASSEIRGPFRPIKTNVSGIDVCEHLPRHAKTAHRFSLIRSCTHDEADHFAGHRRFLSGYGQLKAGTSYESHYPQVGAVINRHFDGTRKGMPPALSVGGVIANGPDYAAGISEGYLPGQYRVPIVSGGIRDASLTVDGKRLDDRLALQKSFDGLRRDIDVTGTMNNIDACNRQALEILTTGRVQQAFDLQREPARIRERYGDGYGQEVLTARRLVEAGVRFVTVRAPGGGVGTKAYDWDDHAVNWDMKAAMLARLPKYDQIVTTLIDDLFDRGLDQRVLLVVTGEFGRTPRLENKDGVIGRDHWPSAMSILISGGGMPMGQVIGSTTSTGERPKERALDPHDVLATVYHHLGIDHAQMLADAGGRIAPLTRGEPIRELF